MAIRQRLIFAALGLLGLAIVLHLVGLQWAAEPAGEGTFFVLLATVIFWPAEKQR